MTELEIKILANKTYDSMVSQMRNIPGTTDDEIDIFMDKFTKNLREILIKENPEDSGFDRIEIEDIKQYVTEPFKIEFSEAINKIGSKNDLIYAFYEITNRINSTSDLDIKINEDDKAEIWHHCPSKEELFEKTMQNNAANRLYKTIFDYIKQFLTVLKLKRLNKI